MSIVRAVYTRPVGDDFVSTRLFYLPTAINPNTRVHFYALEEAHRHRVFELDYASLSSSGTSDFWPECKCDDVDVNSDNIIDIHGGK